MKANPQNELNKKRLQGVMAEQLSYFVTDTAKAATVRAVRKARAKMAKKSRRVNR